MKMYNANCSYGGYFQREVTVHVDGRLEYCPYGQCGYIFRDGWYYLISYESVIFGYNPTTEAIEFPKEVGRYRWAAPDYSRTTIKHVIAFCKEFCPQYTYHDIKRMYYEQLG